MVVHVSRPLTAFLAFGLFTTALGCTGAVGGDQLGAYGGSGSTDAIGTAGSASAGNSSAGSGSSSGGSGSTAGAGSVGGAGSSEFPCDVQQLLATKCVLCHKVDPPGSLLTAADFRKSSKADPSKTVGQLALARLASTGTDRMPPAPLEAATAAEIAALSTWVNAGAMPSNCGQTVPDAPNPYDTPVTCTSMKNWTGGNRESPLMRPGGECISCHSKGEGPTFAVAGTVFPSAHEPDDCNGVSTASGAQVVITEANGTAHTLSVNAAGNFFLETRAFAFPYTAKVVAGGKERVMVEAQKSGDCNVCHTQTGTQNAPGRIMAP